MSSFGKLIAFSPVVVVVTVMVYKMWTLVQSFGG